MKRFINWIKSFFQKKPLVIPSAKQCPVCKENYLVEAFGPEQEPVWLRMNIGKDNYGIGPSFNVSIHVCTNCDFIQMNHEC